MMRFPRSMSIVAALLALAGVAVTFAAPANDEEGKSKVAKVGEAAPDFTLKTAEGKAWTLSEHKGHIVVLQWINPDCPVCARVHKKGLAKEMAEQLKEMDENIVYVAINSTNYMEGKATAAYLEKHESGAPGLIDADGKVGHLYAAKTTPHMYVIDAKGVLRYEGAIDDDRRGSKGDDRMNYVINAVKQIKAGETVSPDQTRPYGCSVKYARGK